LKTKILDLFQKNKELFDSYIQNRSVEEYPSQNWLKPPMPKAKKSEPKVKIKSKSDLHTL
jgi:hypothetical protein